MGHHLYWDIRMFLNHHVRLQSGLWWAFLSQCLSRTLFKVPLILSKRQWKKIQGFYWKLLKTFKPYLENMFWLTGKWLAMLCINLKMNQVKASIWTKLIFFFCWLFIGSKFSKLKLGMNFILVYFMLLINSFILQPQKVKRTKSSDIFLFLNLFNYDAMVRSLWPHPQVVQSQCQTQALLLGKMCEPILGVW